MNIKKTKKYYFYYFCFFLSILHIIITNNVLFASLLELPRFSYYCLASANQVDRFFHDDFGNFYILDHDGAFLSLDAASVDYFLCSKNNEELCSLLHIDFLSQEQSEDNVLRESKKELLDLYSSLCCSCYDIPRLDLLDKQQMNYFCYRIILRQRGCITIGKYLDGFYYLKFRFVFH